MKRVPLRAVATGMVAYFFLGALFWSCGFVSPGPDHILLVTIDSLSPEQIYGTLNEEGSAPQIRAFAAGSARFRRAVTHSPVTLPALASLLTGRLPNDHGIRADTGYRLGRIGRILPEFLQDRNYRTGAVVGTTRLGRISGLNRGFEIYRVPGGQDGSVEAKQTILADRQEVRMDAAEVTRGALLWLRQNFEARTFLWVHYSDLHHPYQLWDDSGPQSASYHQVLANLDREVGKLLDGYRLMGVYDRTLVILTADHGESLGEHGEETHSNFLYRSTVEIPLYIGGGGDLTPAVSPGEVGGLARLIDIYPTLAEWVGFVPGEDLPGSSLIPRILGDDSGEQRISYAESLAPLFRFGWSPLRSVETADWRYIDRGDGGELFRIDRDPGEMDNRITAGDTPLERFRELLDEHDRNDPVSTRLWGMGQSIGPGKRRETLKILTRSSVAVAGGDRDTARVDLQMILREQPGNLVAARQLAAIHLEEKDFPGAEKLLRTTVEFNADLAEARAVMAKFYRDSRRYRKAAAEYLQAYELAARVPYLLLAAAEEFRGGRLEEAIFLLETALEMEADSAFLQAMTAHFYWEFLDYQNAIRHYRRAGQLNPADEVIYRKLVGDCLQKLGKFKEAIAVYREVEESSPWIQLSMEIGDTYILMSQEDAAVGEFARNLSPQDTPAKRAVDLANLLSEKGLSEKALEILTAADRQNPGDPELLYTRGEIRLAARDLDGAEADFQSTLKLAPDNGSVLYNLARIDLLRQDPVAALGHLRQARDRDEQSLKEFLAQDPFFRQMASGDSSLSAFVQQMLGEDPDE